ncbi:hypothetical protein H6P81_019646 [Aristolochia fimbriata]|uniref:NAC domain-containing protein n=1 Tax=Aristolochia fimbriata TaxID=158543 RepID=A0AAV7DVE1_ARIFI|nr:hypothetical protein H6P81_019646 [Aristolochia fimbriata]
MEMEEMKKSSSDDQAGDVIFPGFRFHPTDEELVGFYLRRKVENKPVIMELIKQIDIYKYDPWDLPKVSSVGEKEWYFFCLRGRKYRNSIRPNRVTRSGFWKATGIDRPIYTLGEKNITQDYCIGLKKSLVYYKGSAGKGTKTDWMMHEFRLPSTSKNTSTNSTTTTTTPDHVFSASKNDREAEVWTICRIFRRTSSSYRKFTAPRRSTSSTTSYNPETYLPKQPKCKCPKMSLQKELAEGGSSVREYIQRENCSVLGASCTINIDPAENSKQQQVVAVVPQLLNHNIVVGDHSNHFLSGEYRRPITPGAAPYSSFPSSDSSSERACKYGDWDELGVVVDCAMDPNLSYMTYR